MLLIKISSSLSESKHLVNEEKGSYFVIEMISLATSQSLCRLPLSLKALGCTGVQGLLY